MFRSVDVNDKHTNDDIQLVSMSGRRYPSVVIVTMVYQKETGMLVKSVLWTFFSA